MVSAKSCDDLTNSLTKALIREKIWNALKGMELKPKQS